MTRPTMPPGPPYPEDNDPQEAGQPRFTPRQSGPQPPYEPPTYQGPPPYDAPPPPAPPGPHQASSGYDPYPPPPPAARAADDRAVVYAAPARRRRAARAEARADRDGRPRPTFTPARRVRAARGPGRAPPRCRRRSCRRCPRATRSLHSSRSTTRRHRRGPRRGSCPPIAADKPTARQADLQDNRTRVLEPDAGAVRATGPQRAAETTSPNLARSSKVMALGTIASRGTGFLRTLVLVIALGQGTLADAYNNSNTLPNTVYYLMLGGIFTSVVVPMLVRAAKEDPDRGEGYAQRIYSLGVISLLAHHPGGHAARRADRRPVRQQHLGPPRAPGHGGVRLLLHPADLLLRDGLAARRDTQRARPVRRPTCGRRSSTTSWSILVALLYWATDHSTSADTVSSLRPQPARDRHHARHRDPVGLPLPHHVARRVQHAADLRLPPLGDLRDRPDVRLDVRLRGDPVARQPGRAAGGELGRELGRAPEPARHAASASPPGPTPTSSSSCLTRSSASRSSARCCPG